MQHTCLYSAQAKLAAGAIGEDMGDMAVQVELEGAPVTVLKRGSYFGELALLRDMRRSASVRCISETCDLFVLTKASADLQHLPCLPSAAPPETHKHDQRIACAIQSASRHHITAANIQKILLQCHGSYRYAADSDPCS